MTIRFHGRTRYGFSCSALLVLLVGCGGGSWPGDVPSGGTHNVGGGQRGVGDPRFPLALGDIAVEPSGDFIVFQSDGTLAVGWPETGLVQSLPVTAPTRLAFSKKRPVVYVASNDDGAVHAIDVAQRTELWATPANATHLMDFMSGLHVATSKDDRRVLVSSNSEVRLLDAQTGEILAEKQVPAVVQALEVLPDDRRALILPNNVADGTPVTHVTVLELEAGATRTVDVPNCADSLVVTPDGKRAFLAPSISPSLCGKDPISTLDLTPGSEAFVKNVPGFGPLVLGPDGATAVGFADMAAVDDSLFDDPTRKPSPSPRFHLVILDTQTLNYEFVAWGESLPRSTLSPDGRALLVDAELSTATRLFDIETRKFREVQGPPLHLENFVIAADSAHAFFLQPAGDADTVGLFDLDLVGAKSSAVSTGFVPRNINLSPDNRTLFLRRDDASVCVFSLAERRCRANIGADESDI